MTKITVQNWSSKECKPHSRGGWTVPELRQYCREHNLRVSGNKGELCNRVRNHIITQKRRLRQRNCKTVMMGLQYCPDRKILCDPRCHQAIREYHQVCDRVWNRRCKGRNLTEREAREIASRSQSCADLRTNYALNCCGGYVDKQHLGAIKKMQRLSRECRRRK